MTIFWVGVVMAFIAWSIAAFWAGIAFGLTVRARDRQVPSQNGAKS